MNEALSYERLEAAEEAYAKHPFDNEIVKVGNWAVAARASRPDDTLMREVTIAWNDRTYVRVFAVVFHADALTVEETSFGDMLP